MTRKEFSLREYVSSQNTDQNGCSTCWIFAAVAAFESAYAKKHDVQVLKLSEEQVYDCVPVAHCQHRDNPWTALWQLSLTGTVKGAEDPYVPDKSECGTIPGQYFAAEPLFIGYEPDVDTLKQALVALGPLTVSVLANDAFKAWHSSGEFDFCDDSGEMHYVLLVGWNERGWLIKNSWRDWGEEGSGFGWIRYGCNQIGNNAMAVRAR